MFTYLHEKIAAWELDPLVTTGLSVLLDLLRCVAIIVIGLLVSYCLRLAVKRLFTRRHLLFPERNYLTAATMVSSIVKYAAYFIIFAQILTVFGISTTSILAVAGIGSIAIGLGAQKIVADLVSGASILLENHFNVGDWIEISGQSGEVESIGLRSTRLKSLDGARHIFPNSTIQTVINSSQGAGRAVVDVPVAYRENIEHIFALLEAELQEAEKMDAIISGPEIQGITALGEHCLIIRVLATTPPGGQGPVERRLRYRIKQCFERAGVAAPHPAPLNSAPGKEEEK
jgi:small conductance mechanosensitive channel